MAFERGFFLSRQPGDVVAQRRVLRDEIGEIGATETAQARVDQRLDRMGRRFVEGALQADQIAGEHEIENLPAPILERTRANEHAVEQGKQAAMQRAFLDQDIAALQRDFAVLEPLHVGQLVRLERAQSRTGLERTLDTGNRIGNFLQRGSPRQAIPSTRNGPETAWMSNLRVAASAQGT